MLSGPVALLFLVDFMACVTCSTETWNKSSSVESFLVFLSMTRFILFVLCCVELTNC